MTYHRLGRGDDARTAYRRGVARMDAGVPAPAGGDIGDAVEDWLICHIARREAEAVLGTSGGG